MAAQRFTTAERRALELAQSDVYNDVRRAAEAHRLGKSDHRPEREPFFFILQCTSTCMLIVL